MQISSRMVQGHEKVLHKKGQKGDEPYHLVKVQDNGIGFEKEDAERIFNVFTRLHGNTQYKGTGVGLFIARKVAENHHGCIWAEGQPVEGATFNLLLPAE